MKITQVSFRKLVTGPGYNNRSVGAEAAVEEGETAEDAMLKLTAWVNGQLGEQTPDLSTLREDVSQLYRVRDQLRAAITGAERDKLELTAELDKLAQKIIAAGGEDPRIPF
jgi:hypothetical protein